MSIGEDACAIDAFQRGELDVGFAWALRAVIYTSDMSVVTPVFMRHGLTEATGVSDSAASVALACELRENNNTLTTIRFKHDEARL